MAGLHMRTWSNALPSRLIRTRHPWAALPMAKSACRCRTLAGQPYALAKGRAAASAKNSARRTVRALA